MDIDAQRSAFPKNVNNSVSHYLLDHIWSFPFIRQFFVLTNKQPFVQHDKLSRKEVSNFLDSFVMICLVLVRFL